MFLKGMGKTALAIPLLPSLAPTELLAQTPPPRRFFSFSGTFEYGHHMHWFPTLDQPGRVFDPNPAGAAHPDHVIHYERLQSYLDGNNSLSRVLGSGLNPFVNKMNIYRSLNFMNFVGHSTCKQMGNWRDTPHDTSCDPESFRRPDGSFDQQGYDDCVRFLNWMNTHKHIVTIDQVLANNRNFTPHPSDPLMWGLGLSWAPDGNGGAQRAGTNHDITYRNPHRMFESLFMNNGQWRPENGDTNQEPPHPRLDILSRVLGDYNRVRNGRRISSVDRQRLDNAMDQISDIQARLGITRTAEGCRYSHIDVSASRARGDWNSGWYYDIYSAREMYGLYARIYAAAASCDLHRVFNFHVNLDKDVAGYTTEGTFHGDIGPTHAPFRVYNGKVNHQHMAELWRDQVNAFLVPLLEGLEAQTEGDGATILDHSLVHFTMESSTTHSSFGQPCATFGSAGGALTTGHLIDYSDRQKGPLHAYHTSDWFSANPQDHNFSHNYFGAHYNRILVTILQALGLQRSDYEDSTINGFFRNRTDGLLGSHNNNISNVGGFGHIGLPGHNHWDANNRDRIQFDIMYANHDFHNYKNPLPMPPVSAS